MTVCNCCCRDLPDTSFGVLEEVSDLKQAMQNTLLDRATRSLHLLTSCLETLHVSVEKLEDALKLLFELSELEETEKLLKDGPVFSSLPLNTFAAAFRRLLDEHRLELVAKEKAVADFVGVFDRLRTIAKERGHRGEDARPAASETKHIPALRRPALEPYLQVHITAWMLDACIDVNRVAHDIALITEECAL